MWVIWSALRFRGPEWVECAVCMRSYHEMEFDRFNFYYDDKVGPGQRQYTVTCECCYRRQFPLQPFENMACLHCIAQERQNCVQEILGIRLHLYQQQQAFSNVKPLLHIVTGYLVDVDKWLRFCPEVYALAL